MLAALVSVQLFPRRVPPRTTSETTFFPTWNCDFPPKPAAATVPTNHLSCSCHARQPDLCSIYTPKDGNSCLSVIWPAHAGIELSVRGEQPDESAASAGMDFEMLHNPNTSRMMSAYRFVHGGTHLGEHFAALTPCSSHCVISLISTICHATSYILQSKLLHKTN